MVVKFTKYDFLDAICLSPKVIIRKGDEIPFVEMANVATGNRKEPMAIEMRKFSGGTKFEKGDTVVASIEPCLQHGKSFYFTEHDRGAGSTEYLVFRGIEDITTNEFVHYFMMSYEIRAAMIRSMKGATGRQRVDPEVFTGMKIELPDIPTQKKIAAVLSNYDAAMANCRKQIALLEEAAMRLYREWFGDGKGEKGPISKWFNITIGCTPPRKVSAYFSESDGNLKWCSIADIKSTNTYMFDTAEKLTPLAVADSKIHISPPGTILLSFKLTVGRVAIAADQIATNEAIAHFETDDRAFRDYTYCYLKDFKFSTLGSTSSIGTAINSDIVKDMPFLKPKDETVKHFSCRISPLFDSIFALGKQIRSLTEARDRLLPKLMKGEIEV